MIDFAQARRLMVDGQLRTFDVNAIPVLDAFDAIARERYAPPGREAFAYSDQPLRYPCEGDARVMPAPMTLARMIQALRIGPGVRVLDVGAGYGYASAILAYLGAGVVALESDAALAAEARARLDASVEVLTGPLAEGAQAQGPYDAILVQGRVETRPERLLASLKDEGRLVCVYGPEREAKATLFVRAGDAYGARPLFDAALPALDAFAAARGFRF